MLILKIIAFLLVPIILFLAFVGFLVIGSIMERVHNERKDYYD